jgi:hypothetical protein
MKHAYADPVVEEEQEPSALAKAGTMLADVGRGVARAVPELGAMLYDTAAMLAPGKTPRAENPEGEGAAGWLGSAADYARTEGTEWYAPRSQGWWAVPGTAATSLAQTGMAAAAAPFTGGATMLALPLSYGGSRAQEIYRDMREKAHGEGRAFDADGARVQAAIGGALEGGLEAVGAALGMGKALLRAAQAGARGAAPAAARTLAVKLRDYAKSMAWEAATEAAQEGGGDLQNQLLGIADYSGEEPRRIADVDWRGLAEKSGMGAAAGALGAGAAGGIELAGQGKPAGKAAAEIVRQAAETPTEEAAEVGADYDPLAGQAGPPDGADGSGATPPDPLPAPPRREGRRRVRSASDDLWRDNPVAATVVELGGIRSGGTEDQAGIPLHYLTSNPNANSADQMLRELQSEMPQTADWTVDDLIDALRKKNVSMSARRDSPDEAAWRKTAQGIQPQHLAEGMTFAVRGVRYRVEAMDDGGAVIGREDGGGGLTRMRPGGLAYIDEGSLSDADGRPAPLETRSPEMLDIEEAERERDRRLEGLPPDEAVNAEAADAAAQGEDEELPLRKDTEREDAEYLDAVRRGDIEKAQRMVDAAAKKRGYRIGYAYHSEDGDLNGKDYSALDTRGNYGAGVYFARRREDSAGYGKNTSRAWLKLSKPIMGYGAKVSAAKARAVLEELRASQPESHARFIEYFGADAYRGDLLEWYSSIVNSFGNDAARDVVPRIYGVDGVYAEGGKNIVIFNPSQIKLADAVTYDDDGEAIPLSRRFDSGSNDIRFRDAAADAAPEENARQYQAVHAAHHNPDGTPKKTWMKAPNGRPTRLDERQWVHARTENFKRRFGDWERLALVRMVRSMKPVDASASTAVSGKRNIKDTFMGFGKATNALDGETVKFPNGIAGKVLYQSGVDNIGLFVPAFKDAFEQSVPAFSEPHEHRPGRKDRSGVERYRNYVGKIKTAGAEYYVRFTVMQEKNTGPETPDNVHASTISEIALYETAKGVSETLRPRYKPGGGMETPFVDTKLADWFAGVNPADVSKMVDENGEPMVADDDIMFREDAPGKAREGAAEKDSQWLRTAPRGLTALPRGYQEAAAPAVADNPRFTRFPVELPELVELATDLLGGRAPRVGKKVFGRESALGAVLFPGGQTDPETGLPVHSRPAAMALKAENYRLVERRESDALRAAAEAAHPEDADAAAAAFAADLEALTRSRLQAQPALAAAVIAHEIGHIADRMPRFGKIKGGKQLNLLGRVAAMMDYSRTILADDPTGATLDKAALLALRARALRGSDAKAKARELWRATTNTWGDILRAHPEYRGVLSAAELSAAIQTVAAKYPVLAEWFALADGREQAVYVEAALRAFAGTTADQAAARKSGGKYWFRAAFARELEAARQVGLETMREETARLAAWWATGDEHDLPDTLGGDSEMFAEAFAAYLNNPAAAKKRAPAFYRTLEAYMGRRPEMQAWLDAAAEAAQPRAGGRQSLVDRRYARVRRMFGPERQRAQREIYARADASVSARTGRDAALFYGFSMSEPLRGLANVLERTGAPGKTIADRARAAADRAENIEGAKELFKTMNLEVGRILDAANLTLADFDTWAFFDMVSRSPAYRDRANPLGFHPAAAAESLADMERRMGPERSDALRRASAASRRIWQGEVVDRLEAAGALAPETIRMMRENPVYYTLQVGMDEKEIADWQSAMRSDNPETTSAAIMQSVGRLGFGQVPDAAVHARVGTHRNAVSLFGASLAKGGALIHAAAQNELARQAHELLQASGDPLYRPLTSDEDAKSTAMQTVVRYKISGEEVRYLAPKYIGDFAAGRNAMSGANAMLRSSKLGVATRMLKQMQTVLSARFILTQPWADRKAWNTQMPGTRTPLGDIVRGDIRGLARMIPAGTWILPPALFPAGSRERMMREMRGQARAYYRRGEISPMLRDLVQRGMYDLGGAWQGMRAGRAGIEMAPGGNPMAETPRALADAYAADVTGWQRAMRAISRSTGLDWAQEQMHVETLANKMAGMRAVDERMPAADERTKRETVLRSAGNPNFAAKAGADPWIDTFAWAFYNPAKEGYRSAIFAARQDPRGFAARAAYYNVAPKIIAAAAGYGLLSALATALVPPAETPEDEERRASMLRGLRRWEALYGRMSSYYGRRYMAIPVAPVGADAALAITVPQAQSLAPANGIIDALIREGLEAAGARDPSSRAPESLINALTTEIPLVDAVANGGRSMLAQLVAPALTIMFTDKNNWYDSFYGRNLLDQNEEQIVRGGKFAAEAMPIYGKLMKQAWNTAFGSMLFRFDLSTPNAEREARPLALRMLSGSALSGGWVRVVGGGAREQMEEALSAPAAADALGDIEARRAAADAVENGGRLTPADAARMLDDPVFARAVSRFVSRNRIYGSLTPSQRMLLNRTRTERQRIIETRLWQRLREQEQDSAR